MNGISPHIQILDSSSSILSSAGLDDAGCVCAVAKLSKGSKYYIKVNSYMTTNVNVKVCVNKHEHIPYISNVYSSFVSYGCAYTSCHYSDNVFPSIKLSSTSLTYTGKTLTPKETISDSVMGKIDSSSFLKTYKDDDWLISNVTPKAIGRYDVLIYPNGDYYGLQAITASFNIVPKGTSIKSLTKAKKSFKIKWNKQSSKMYVHQSSNSKYITGYQVQYSTSSKFASGNKTVTIKGYKNVSKKISKLKAKKKYYVRVRTYMQLSNNKKYYSSWSGTKSVTTK